MATIWALKVILDKKLVTCTVSVMALGTPDTAWSMFLMEGFKEVNRIRPVTRTNPFQETSL